MLSGARPGQHETKRSGEYSIVTTGADYSAIDKGDVERMDRARVPHERQVALTKPEIAIEEIDRVITSGAGFGCVLADAGKGRAGRCAKP